jgi:hypothetical protein
MRGSLSPGRRRRDSWHVLAGNIPFKEVFNANNIARLLAEAA